MNLTALADLTNAVSDYEMAWRAMCDADFQSDDYAQAQARIEDAQVRIDAALPRLYDLGEAINRALALAAARTRTSEVHYRRHLTNAYTHDFIREVR